MVSVTQRIKTVKQPKGGYINPKSFNIIQRNDNQELFGQKLENVHASLVGLAVDYLTRALLYNAPLEAFKISIMGATIIGEQDAAVEHAQLITNLSKESITSACQLAGYDVCFRSSPAHYKPVQNILPDDNTIKNIEIMVKRSIQFFQKYGPVIEEGFTFSGGYTDTVNAGDGDFITDDTLWDFKVSIAEPKKEHTLQLLMYYLMGLHSNDTNLHEIKKLGIFNPRLNKVYLLNVSDVSSEIIKSVEADVIGY